MQIGAFIVTAYKSHFLKMTVNGQNAAQLGLVLLTIMLIFTPRNPQVGTH